MNAARLDPEITLDSTPQSLIALDWEIAPKVYGWQAGAVNPVRVLLLLAHLDGYQVNGVVGAGLCLRCEERSVLLTVGRGTMLNNTQAHMASLMPRRMSHTLAGHDVAKPMTMPICMKSQ